MYLNLGKRFECMHLIGQNKQLKFTCDTLCIYAAIITCAEICCQTSTTIFLWQVQKTSVSFTLICYSPWQPNHNWMIGEAQHIFLFSRTSMNQQINCLLAVAWPFSFQWQCYVSVQILSFPIFANVKGVLNESSKLETAV